MRAIGGSILVLAASVCCVLIMSGQIEDTTVFLSLPSIPFALGLYFLFSKDKPGAWELVKR